MAIKTMSAGGGGGEKFKEGWHEVEISGAEYGTYEAGNGDSKKYIDVLMKDYPENMNIRVYETFNNTTKEEFKIANLFKHANVDVKTKDLVKNYSAKAINSLENLDIENDKKSELIQICNKLISRDF